MRLAGVQRGLKGRTWPDNLAVWPAAASSGCAEMTTPFSPLTYEPVRPGATASAATGGGVVWAQGNHSGTGRMRLKEAAGVVCVIVHFLCMDDIRSET